MLTVIHAATGVELASWDLWHVVGKFVTKFERLLFVRADVCKTSSGEEFHYNAASLLMNPSTQTFRNGFLSGRVLIDVRMHERPSGAVRNHGTGFRVRERDLPSLFGDSDDLLQ